MNRLLITSLTVIGLAMDGFQQSDVMFGAALVLWLYLHELNKYEAKLLSYLAKKKGKRVMENVTKSKVS